MGAARHVWDEAKHPRGPGGKFASKAGGASRATRKVEHAAGHVDWAQPKGVDWAQPKRAGHVSAPKRSSAPHAPTPKGGVEWAQPKVDWAQPRGSRAPAINPRGRSEPHAPSPKSSGVTWAQPGVAWAQPKSSKSVPKKVSAPKAPAPSGGVAWAQPGVEWAQPKKGRKRTAASMMGR